jgi:ABC-type transport system involved in cytochrome c biogenesis permease component
VIVILLVLPLAIPILIFGISTTIFSLQGMSPLPSIYLQCMSLSFLIAVVPVITSKAIKIYVE